MLFIYSSWVNNKQQTNSPSLLCNHDDEQSQHPLSERVKAGLEKADGTAAAALQWQPFFSAVSRHRNAAVWWVSNVATSAAFSGDTNSFTPAKRASAPAEDLLLTCATQPQCELRRHLQRLTIRRGDWWSMAQLTLSSAMDDSWEITAMFCSLLLLAKPPGLEQPWS